MLGKRTMPGAEWFPGAEINYARHMLRHERPNATALLHLNERQPLQSVSWEELGAKVRIVATQLRKLGVKRGDRVCAYMVNVPETLIAMLATTSLGAIWSSVGPDFGTPGVLDRFSQLEPTVFFHVDGYQYGGKPFDRRAEVEKILATPHHREACDPASLPGYRESAPRSRRAPSSGTSCSTIRRWRARPSSTKRCRSTIRCGSCSPPAPPACPSPSCTATAAS